MAHSSTEHPANRLAGETSPYLLQHAHNPVDWYPWGPEALARAQAEDKPIFLSVGYSACHWCHVMEHESFEDAAIAALDERALRQHQGRPRGAARPRPDLHDGRAGADRARRLADVGVPDARPAAVLRRHLLPARPTRAGCPASRASCRASTDAWKERRDEIVASAGEMTEHLRAVGTVPAGQGELGVKLLDGAARSLARRFDPTHGGFGQAPKFPHPMDLRVLLRQHARTGDAHALAHGPPHARQDGRGGIYDQLGGGFDRYSTDERWLVPHFEKMLYDNALLASAYLEAYQATGDPDYARVARETLDYVLGRDDRAPRGRSTAPRTPTAKARRASSTSGRRRGRDVLGPERAEGVRLRLRRDRARQLGGARTS